MFIRGLRCVDRSRSETQEKTETSSHVVFFIGSTDGPSCILGVSSGAANCWSRPLTMVMMNWNEDNLGLVPGWFFNFLKCLDHFHVDPAIAYFGATRHQLETLCCSICAEKRAQILSPFVGSKNLLRIS